MSMPLERSVLDHKVDKVQTLQGPLPSLGSTNSLHYDEICFLRDHRRGYLRPHARQEI